MDLGLSGKRALVGGDGGIGGGIAGVLAAEGARLVLVGRTASTLEARGAELDAGASPSPTWPRPTGRHWPWPRVWRSSVASISWSSTPAGRQPAHSRHSVRRNGSEPSPARCSPPSDSSARPSRICGRGRPGHRHQPQLVGTGAAPGLTTSNVLRPGLAGLIKNLAFEIVPIRINGVAPGRFDTARVAQLDGARARAGGISVEEVRREAQGKIPLGRYGHTAGDRPRGGVPALAGRLVGRRDRARGQWPRPRSALASQRHQRQHHARGNITCKVSTTSFRPRSTSRARRRGQPSPAHRVRHRNRGRRAHHPRLPRRGGQALRGGARAGHRRDRRGRGRSCPRRGGRHGPGAGPLPAQRAGRGRARSGGPARGTPTRETGLARRRSAGTTRRWRLPWTCPSWCRTSRPAPAST